MKYFTILQSMFEKGMWEKKNSRYTNIFLMDEDDIETMATEFSIGLNILKLCLF